jgi:hypothetical protein
LQVSGKPQDLEFDDGSPALIEGEFIVKNQGMAGQMFGCQLEGRPISQGGKLKFLLRVKNSSELELRFDQIKVFCDCLEVKCEQLSVKPGESLELQASYQAPTKYLSVRYGFHLGFQLKDQTVGIVSISGDLHNTLVIRSNGLYESSGLISTWEIPLLTSHPVDIKRLRVELDDSLLPLTAEIVKKDDNAFVRVEGPEASLGISGLSGAMRVFDPELGLSDTSYLTFVKTPLVKVSPMFARFVEVKDRPGYYSTSFFVQALNISRPTEDAEEKVENHLSSVEIKSDVYDLEIKKIQINERLWRFELFVNRSETKKGTQSNPLNEEFELVFVVDSILGKLSFECNCYFLENSK